MTERPTRATAGGRAYLDLRKTASTAGRPTDELLQPSSIGLANSSNPTRALDPWIRRRYCTASCDVDQNMPLIPLLDTTLLTNAPGEPTCGAS